MKPKIDSKWLRERCRVDPRRHLFSLLLDHATLIALVSSSIFFDRWRDALGLHWLWTAAAWLPAAMVSGAIQHRIALMGHEASHYLLHPNRKWNDVLAELLCFYPLFGTVAKYRAKHLNHHLYPNDSNKDPNLAGGKLERFYAHFPMAKRTFYLRHYLGFLWPPFVLTNLIDLVRVVTLGGGIAAEADRKRREDSAPRHWATTLGAVYVVLLVGSLRLSNHYGGPLWLPIGVGFFAALVGWSFLPGSAFFQGANVAVSPRLLALLRLTFYTLLFAGFAVCNRHIGYQFTVACLVLWVLPLVYILPYFMIVREIFQHANAGTGELDNSRISRLGPIARWAIMGYGNDYHLIHHLYPNVPSYCLEEVHHHLLAHVPHYRETVIETAGFHHGRDGRISLLDSLAEDHQGPPSVARRVKTTAGAPGLRREGLDRRNGRVAK